MTSTVSTPRASFRSETFAALMPMIESSWAWIAGFIVAMAAVSFMSLSGAEQSASLKSHPELLMQHPEIIAHMATAGLGQILVSLFAAYIFVSLYLKRAAKNAPPRMNVGNFFYWFGKSLQKYLITVGGLFVVGIIAGIATALKLPMFLIAVVALVALVASYYIFLRLQLVSPMAILRRKPVLKNSWALTKGQCGRIFWGMFSLMFLIALMSIIPYIVVSIVVSMLSHSAVLASIANSLMMAAVQVIMSIATAVYSCTVYRILLREQKNSVPSAS